jgi:hypothetical protein
VPTARDPHAIERRRRREPAQLRARAVAPDPEEILPSTISTDYAHRGRARSRPSGNSWRNSRSVEAHSESNSPCPITSGSSGGGAGTALISMPTARRCSGPCSLSYTGSLSRHGPVRPGPRDDRGVDRRGGGPSAMSVSVTCRLSTVLRENIRSRRTLALELECVGDVDAINTDTVHFGIDDALATRQPRRRPGGHASALRRLLGAGTSIQESPVRRKPLTSIAFVGLGAIGLPMATQLAQSVTPSWASIYSRPPASAPQTPALLRSRTSPTRRSSW